MEVTTTFKKSGVLPISPYVILAYTSNNLLLFCKSSDVFGNKKALFTRSPVSLQM